MRVFYQPIRRLVSLFSLAAQATPTEVILHNFSVNNRGANPQAPVIQDHSGNLYGTTFYGGVANAGVVYMIDSSGHQTVLHSFSGGADGGGPQGGVTLDAAGNLYGTASSGGAFNAGVVFKLDTAHQLTVVHSFSGLDGMNPSGNLVLDSAGNIYGSTGLGGTANVGVVYKLDAAGNATVLHSFTGPDGSSPFGGVIRDAAGNLYGVTEVGGSSGGVVYKVDPAGQETVLQNFAGAGGAYPVCTLIRDRAGNLYGTTIEGGASFSGVVFRIDPRGIETVLYSFTGAADGGAPFAGLTADASGNLYGTTNNGGAGGHGVVFKLDALGHETVLHSFLSGNDGAYPMAGVVRDPAGNLFGTTYNGAPANAGIVFKLDSAGTETVIHRFAGGRDGTSPNAVTSDPNGNLYGTTQNGGPFNAGVIYKLDAKRQETILYSFTGGADGAMPSFTPLRDAAGNLYGTTFGGGAANAGVVYKLDTSGVLTVLYSFQGGVDGATPSGALAEDTSGNLYGTTAEGGTYNLGTVFKLDTAGSHSVLHSFAGGWDGTNPGSGVILGPAGRLYGATGTGGPSNRGLVYAIDPSGLESFIYVFNGQADGGGPGALIQDASGNLYGCGDSGGTANSGVLFEIPVNGLEKVLYNFTGGSGGALPGSVIRDASGNFYGSTLIGGGAANVGVVFKIDANGQETVLYSFTGGSDGAYPSSVIRGAAGNLYGTANLGGTARVGVVFEIKP